MPTPVVMPQMGESIAEGTIVRWIKKVGDSVDRDEPLFEISTDKVDAEIPSPSAGILVEIKVSEGETVPVNSVVATIGEANELPSEPARTATHAAAVDVSAQARIGTSVAAASTQQQPDGAGPTAPHISEGPEDGRRRHKSSPLVRRIAEDNRVDIGEIAGSGLGGRVTKRDILQYLEQHSTSRAPQPAGGGHEDTGGARQPARHAGGRVEIQPLSVMRKKIAEHMVLSRRTSAHVHTVFHVNFTVVERLRQQRKADYERRGAKLTYMAFIAKATVDALRQHPIVNASLDGDNIVYKKDVNLGIAVALDSGLIVPVIKNAEAHDLFGLSGAIVDLAERARTKRLKHEEVQDGTFTITNPGQFGSQFGLPIINQPQAAILGVGTIEKRPIVIEDAIAIRTMGYLALGFDHRLIDGATADQFMSSIKARLEQFDPAQV